MTERRYFYCTLVSSSGQLDHLSIIDLLVIIRRSSSFKIKSRCWWRRYTSEIIYFLDIIHRLFYLSKVSGTGLCLRPQVNNLLSWTQSVQLVPISGHQNEHRTVYANQTKYDPSAIIKDKCLKTPPTWVVAWMQEYMVSPSASQIRSSCSFGARKPLSGAAEQLFNSKEN
jgi:hypothetical protein